MNIKDTMVSQGSSKYMVYPFGLGVGDKYLSETILSYQIDDSVDPAAVKLIKNIVKQKHRFVLFNGPGIFKLSKFNGDNK